MQETSASPSVRQAELLEAAYRYALSHGLADLSLRPLATAIGSSPRVLLYLFGNKDGLVRALLARARAEELDLLADLDRRAARAGGPGRENERMVEVAERLWAWLAAEHHRPLLTLWLEGYARSLIEPEGPWAGFAGSTVQDWLAVLATTQPESTRNTDEARAQRTLVLAVLRGALLDLLASGDVERTTQAVRRQLHGL